MPLNFRSSVAGLIVAAGVLSGVGLSALSAAADDAPWLNESLSPDQRASLLVARLTLDEKATLLIQTGGPGLPQYGVPAIRGKDASNGVTVPGGSTALPVGLSLASSWDPDLAKDYGVVAGQETREAGYNSAASPSVDLTRTPWGGRIWEGYGEDPLLSGQLGAAQTNGIQEADIPAEVKHYNLYNAESRRGNVDVQVDDRTLHEVYIRPWETLVRDADPASVMCSFNKVNSEYACGNNTLLNTILKGQLGFNGFVQTDFNAAKSIQSYNAGLDTSGETLDYSGDNLVKAVKAGIVPEARVTDAARRVLRGMFKYNIIDYPPVNSFTPGTFAPQPISKGTLRKDEEVASQAGAEGLVLLKNARSVLPVDRNTIDSIAVIGSDADKYIDGGGSASVTSPAAVTTMFEGIKQRAGSGITTTFARGTDYVSAADTLPGPAAIPSSVLTDIRAVYRPGIDSESGFSLLDRKESQINLRTGLSVDTPNNTSQIPGVGFPTAAIPITATYTGTFVTPADGSYELDLTSLGTAKLYVDDKLVATNDGTKVSTTPVSLAFTGGSRHAVRVVYTTNAPNQFDGSLNDQPGAMIRLGWKPPQNIAWPQIDEAVRAAKAADVAVVVVRDYTGEAADRASLTLPQEQNKLITAVAAVNPRTIVVLATGGPATMPWLKKVPGVIQAWYGGETQGRDLANVLFGLNNPSGHLPVTFPTSDAQVTGLGISNPFDYVADKSPTAKYNEGIQIGYRNYVKQGATPLFPFGYGLSYTTFDYGQTFRTTRVDATATSTTAAVARVTVRNTGRRAGTTTVQVYAGNLPTRATTPDRALAGYAKVTLRPGQTKVVQVPIDRRSLQYWDTDTSKWVTPTGVVPLYAGDSVTAAAATAGLKVTSH